jgi:HK97 family phage portal protein
MANKKITPQNEKEVGRFKRAMAAIFRIPIEADTGDAIGKVVTFQSEAGQTIDKDTILALSSVWACTRLISETISTLPLTVYERTPNGRQPAVNHPLYKILKLSPNAYSTAQTFIESNIASMLLHGNSWNRIHRFAGEISALEFINPNALTGVKRDSNGNVTAIIYQDKNKDVTLRKEDLFFIPAFSSNGKTGLSTVQHGAKVFGSALAAGESANEHFDNGLMPTTAFSYDKPIAPDQRDNFRSYAAELGGALNAGKSVMLEQGMGVESIGIPPKDSQLLESRLFSVEEICRWFRVDPSMVGHGGKDSNFGTGLEQKDIGFLSYTVNPWLKRIEQRMDKFLLTPEEQTRYYIEFNFEGLLRADSKTRAEFYKTMIQEGVMTRDEVREKENLLKQGGNADKLTVNAATTPLDQVGSGNAGQV